MALRQGSQFEGPAFGSLWNRGTLEPENDREELRRLLLPRERTGISLPATSPAGSCLAGRTGFSNRRVLELRSVLRDRPTAGTIPHDRSHRGVVAHDTRAPIDPGVVALAR